jgi:hypothetical protein
MPRARKKPDPSASFQPPPRQEVVGSVVAIDVDPDQVRQQPPKLDPCAPFLLLYDPARWTVMEGRCVPQLGRLPLEPGIEGVRKDERGRMYWRDAAARRREKGQTVIPHSWGPSGQSYLRSYDLPRGKKVYLEQWATPHAGTSRISVDVDGYADWIDSLFAAERLPAPALWALEELADNYDRQITVARDRATHVPSIASRVDQLVKARDAVRRKLDELAKKAAPVAGASVSFDDDEG